jgi:hypothetical protein
MRKFVISALAAASILGAVSIANAQLIYVPYCTYVFNGWVWSYVCY